MEEEQNMDEIKAPRLCVMKREELGYGFNLHGEKGVVGQYISAVDVGGAADKAGLCFGDRVIEVNGINVESSKHNEVVECIRSDPEQTILLVVDQITDKYLKSKGRAATADLVSFTSVTELYASTGHVATESEIVHTFEDLQFNEGDNGDNNGGSIVSDDIENNGDNNGDNNEEHQLNNSDDENVFRDKEGGRDVRDYNEGGMGERDYNEGGMGERDYNEDRPSAEYVEEYLRPQTTEWAHEEPSQLVVDAKHPGKPGETEYYTGGSAVNILAGTESESESSLRLNTDMTTSTMATSDISTFEKVRPSAVPRRKEIKQGDWRTKLALFDEL